MIKSLGGHTTRLFVLVWNVGKLHTKTLRLGNNNYRTWVGMVVLKSTEKSVNQDHLVSDDSALSPPNDPQSIYNAKHIYFQCHFRIFLAAPHLHFFTKLKKKRVVHTRSPAKYKIKF